jgi:hypothetical protein
MKDEQYRLISNSKYGSEWVIYNDDIGNNTYESNLRCLDMLRNYYSGIINTFPKDIMLEMLQLDILPKDLRNKLIYGK